MKMIPGMNKIDDGMIKSGEEQLKRIEAMIGSMTLDERKQPELLSAQPSRRRRVALGSGYKTIDVDKVLSDFQKMRGLMKQMSSGAGLPGMGGFSGMGGQGPIAGMPPQHGSRASGRSIGSPKRQRPHKKKKGFGDL